LLILLRNYKFIAGIFMYLIYKMAQENENNDEKNSYLLSTKRIPFYLNKMGN